MPQEDYVSREASRALKQAMQNVDQHDSILGAESGVLRTFSGPISGGPISGEASPHEAANCYSNTQSEIKRLEAKLKELCDIRNKKEAAINDVVTTLSALQAAINKFDEATPTQNTAPSASRY